MMWNSEEYYESLLDGWERSETTNGLPYYINHTSECTQWDHPLLVKTLEELVDMDSIRYAAYRTSMKLRSIQKRLCFDHVTLSTIQAVFERQGLSADVDTVVDCGTLYTLLVDMYRLSHTEMMSHLNKDQLAELTLNWLLNLYDVNRTGCIRVVSVKVGLGALCSAKLSEKYRYFFRHLAGLTHHMSRERLQGFLHDLIQIPEVMNESQPFGGMNVSPAVESCFSQVWGPSGGVSEDVFLTWLLQEPQTLVWLPTLHRLTAAESVKHESKCSICKAYPIIGFRYKCLKCFNYDLCQQCFFTGRTTKKHKLKHPTQEYCVATTSKQDTKAFMKIVRNNLSKKHCNKQKLRYLPIYGGDQPHKQPEQFNRDEAPPGDVQDMATKMRHVARPTGNEKYLIQDTEPEKLPPGVVQVGDGGRRELDLHSVIRDLENENRELMKEIERLHGQRRKDRFSGSGSDDDWSREDDETSDAQQEVLEAHNHQLEVQLQRLRHVLRQSTESVRGPLQPISTNIPHGNGPVPTSKSAVAMTPPRLPQQPPSYGVSVGQSPLSSAMSVRGRRQCSPSAAALTRLGVHQSEYDFADDGVCELTPDGSTVDWLSQTRFSLPSLGGSRYFPDEEAALEGLIERLDEAYPADMSHSVLGNGDVSTLEEMLRAANQIGDGLGGFATNIGLDLDLAESSGSSVSPTSKDRTPLGGSTSPVAPSFHGYRY